MFRSFLPGCGSLFSLVDVTSHKTTRGFLKVEEGLWRIVRTRAGPILWSTSYENLHLPRPLGWADSASKPQICERWTALESPLRCLTAGPGRIDSGIYTPWWSISFHFYWLHNLELGVYTLHAQFLHLKNGIVKHISLTTTIRLNKIKQGKSA